MNMRYMLRCAASLLLATGLLMVPLRIHAQASNPYALIGHLSPGGATTGGNYQVGGVVGQSDAGESSGGGYTVGGGVFGGGSPVIGPTPIPTATPIATPSPLSDSLVYLPLLER